MKNGALTHLCKAGSEIKMVNVGQKSITKRYAKAQAMVYVNAEVFRLISSDKQNLSKGPVLTTAQIAGINAAKNWVSNLIPLSHNLSSQIESVDVIINTEVSENKDDSVPAARKFFKIECEVYCESKTGVEMEALTGASVAALTIYDMCKSVDKSISIGDIRLLEKRGGKSYSVDNAAQSD